MKTAISKVKEIFDEIFWFIKFELSRDKFSPLSIAKRCLEEKEPWSAVSVLQNRIEYPQGDIEKANVGEFQKLLDQIKLEFPDWELLGKKSYISYMLDRSNIEIAEGKPWDAIRTLKIPLSKDKYISDPNLDITEITAKLAEVESKYPNWERDEVVSKLNGAKEYRKSLDTYVDGIIFIKYFSLLAFIFGVGSLCINPFDLQAFIERSQSQGFKVLEVFCFVAVLSRMYSGDFFIKLFGLYILWLLSFKLLEFVLGSDIALPVDQVYNSTVFLSVLSGKFLIFWSPVVWYISRQGEIKAPYWISYADARVERIGSELISDWPKQSSMSA
jgi:hypothetical protein